MLAAVLAILPAVAPAAAQGVLDWPQVGGDSAHSGVARTQDLSRCTAPFLTPRWTLPLGRSAQASPAVVGGVLYATTQSGVLAAVNASTGAYLWQRNLGAPLSAPAVEGGRIFVAGGDGWLRALGQADGQEIWRANVSANSAQSPVVGGGAVAIGTDGLHVFDPATGFHRWFTGEPLGSTYEPAIIADSIIVAQDGRLDRYTMGGWPLWSVSAPEWGGSGIRLRLSAAEDAVYAGGFYGTIGAVNVHDGSVLWTASLFGELFAPAAPAGRKFVHSSNSRVYALDGRGVPQWQKDFTNGVFPGGISSNFPPTFARGALFVSTGLLGANGAPLENRVVALDSRDGAELWSAPLGRDRATQPVVANDMVFVQTATSLHAFGLPATFVRQSAPAAPGPNRVFLPILGRPACDA